jgi:hypothetical protein
LKLLLALFFFWLAEVVLGEVVIAPADAGMKTEGRVIEVFPAFDDD